MQKQKILTVWPGLSISFILHWLDNVNMYFFLLDPLPTLSAVIRGPTGRYVWTMQLRQFSRQKNVQYFMLFIQIILFFCSVRNFCNLIQLEQWYFSLIQPMYTFDQWNQLCLRWHLKNWIFLLFFYFFSFWISFLTLLTAKINLWFLNFCLLQWLLTLSLIHMRSFTHCS